MNTDDLIDFLSTRVEAVDPRRQDRILLLALLGALGIAAGASALLLGVRPDFSPALWASPDFLLKIGFLLALSAIGLKGLSSGARAGTARPGMLRLALLPLAIMWVAAAFELAGTPAARWHEVILFPEWALCLTSIPLLSLVPLAVLTLVLREAAPTQLPYCGALLGLLAGGIGALAYATYCLNDAPVYVGLWYAAGIALVTLLGWLTGPRLLRW